MANIPTKRLTALYDKALKNVGQNVKDREWELLISENREIVQLIHYGTVIYRKAYDLVHICGAYSVTDRDNINGLIRLLGVSGGAFIRDKVLHYSDDNGMQISDFDRYGCIRTPLRQI